MLSVYSKLKFFSSGESGNVTVFSVMMLVLILTISGAAVDIMRLEADRAKMQSTLDRSVLAAADLDQEQNPKDVVEDYMAKAGLSEVLTGITPTSGLNYRTVEATGELNMTTTFLHMSGYDTLTAPGLAIAEEKISNVEISLVLDISGSMEGSRLTNMKAAANSFVDTVLKGNGGANSGLTTVSLVPYNATVNLGPTYGSYWAFTDLHDYSNCVTFDAAEFSVTAVDPAVEIQQLGHFDWSSKNQSSTAIPNPFCPTDHSGAVMVHSADKTALQSHIQSFSAGGNTAIDLGVKWGVALLDEASEPAVEAMADDGLVPVAANSRPAAFDDKEAIKFIVVMTDGQNTLQHDLKSHHKFGYSDVWIDDRGTTSKTDDRFSLLVRDLSGTSNDLYFWHSRRNYSYKSDRYKSYPEGANPRRMTNVELFARFGTKAVAEKLYNKPYYDGYVTNSQYNDIYYGYTETVNGNMADDRLDDICSAAKDAGIVVFAIGFEAPDDGQEAMKGCASSDSHYFEVTGEEITETFHSIARQINSLRLIQ